MKATSKLSFLLFASHWKRTLSFLCLILLLSGTAGVLGNHFLSKKNQLETISIAVVDLDQSSETSLLLSGLSSAIDDGNMIQLTNTTEEHAQELLKTGTVSAVFVIPENFFASIYSGENPPIAIAYNPYTPLQSTVLETFVSQILGVLKSSQTGIYTALEYVEKNNPDLYSEMHFYINARYINAATAFNRMVAPEKISITGEVSPFLHYLFTSLIALLLLGCCLFFPILKNNFQLSTILQLRKQKISSLSLVTGWTSGWFLWYGLFGIILVFLYKILSYWGELPFHLTLFPALLLVLLCISSIGVFLFVLFPQPIVASSFLVLYSMLSLFFSGGIIPLQLTHPIIQGISKGFPSYWSALLLDHATTSGQLPLLPVGILLGVVIVHLLLSSFVLHLRTKEVAK